MSSNDNLLISCHTPSTRIRYQEVGGKGWNLFRLKRLGFRVPDWIIVSSQLFDCALKEERNKIKELIEGTDFENQDALRATSGQIADWIENYTLPLMFPVNLSIHIQKLFGTKQGVSVRSSVIGEDTRENSFAGLMDSFLNIHPDHVVAFMKKVWASAYSPRALIYRHRKNLDFLDVSSAVIVQTMVYSTTSGIMFTCNPDTGEKECVITAGYGLGEGVVTNKVETDTYRINQKDGRIYKETNVKINEINTRQEEGVEIYPLEESLRYRLVLKDDQIRKLCSWGMKIENEFSGPQDIEWAFDQNGSLFLLQTRPVIYSCKKLGPMRIWDNSNIVESYPGITLPLTFSFVRECYEKIFRQTTGSFMLFKKTSQRIDHIFKSMIGLLDGHIYYNLSNWYTMLSFLPGFSTHRQAWDQMIGVTRQVPYPPSHLSVLNKIYSWIMIIGRLLTLRSNARRFFRRFNSVYQTYGKSDLQHLTEDDLIGRYEVLHQALMKNWCRTLYNDFGAMKYYDWLKRICSKWGPPGKNHLHHDLLCGIKGVESVEPIHSLIDLADQFRSHPHYLHLLETYTDKSVWGKIQKERKYEELKNTLHIYLERFGDRGIEELKLETPSLQEKPELLIARIRQQCTSPLSVTGMETQEKSIRGHAERIMKKKLSNPIKRLVYLFILKNARQAVANRENMRFARSRAYGMVRRIFQQLSILFVQKGLLVEKNDLFLLTVEEVFGIIRGTAVSIDIRSLSELRKKEYHAYKQHLPAERIQTDGIPYLAGFTEDKKIVAGGTVLHGIGCSAGVAQGTAKIVLNPQVIQSSKNQILIAHSTDPGWVFLMVSSKGMVVEKGSVLSHTAIIGRELGIPTIVGVKNATRLVPNGEMVSIDGEAGLLQWE